jgi:glycosyltransferase involved in cell wall biosynthesis
VDETVDEAVDDVWSGRAGVLLVAEQLRRRVPGGIGTYVRGLLGGLATLDGAGVELPPVTLYASRRGANGREDGGGADPLEGFGRPLIASRLPGPVLTRMWDRAIVHAPRGFDIVHAVSLAVPPLAPSQSRCVEVVAIHDVAWRHRPEDYPSRGRRWHEAALHRALRHASHFVVPSPAVAGDLVQAGAPEGAVSVIPLGSDVLPDRDDAAATALLERLGVRGPFLLSVGTLEPRKNLPRLFEAYGAARRLLPEPLPLVVVGPPGWGPELEHGEGIVFTGRVGDGTLASLYARARLLAYVPFEEGFGLPPVEAMRYGTPVVASPLPTTGGAALEVDPTRVEEIAQALVHVATDDGVRARLAEAGAARAASLTWESAARAHVTLWSSLL